MDGGRLVKHKRLVVHYGVVVYDLARPSCPSTPLTRRLVVAGLGVPGLTERAAIFTAICLGMFLGLLPYGSWRYCTSIPELLALIKATAAAVAIYTIGAFLLTRGYNVPAAFPS